MCPNRRWNFAIAEMSAEPPDDRAAPEGSGARRSSSFPFRKNPRSSARPSSGVARLACTPRARQMKLPELSDSVLFRRQACAHGTARIFGPRANFAAGQLPTLLPGTGGHDGSESLRFDFCIQELNSRLPQRLPNAPTRAVGMASTARHATRADGARPRYRRGLARRSLCPARARSRAAALPGTGVWAGAEAEKSESGRPLAQIASDFPRVMCTRWGGRLGARPDLILDLHTKLDT